MDKDGFSYQELKALLRAVGQNPTDSELAAQLEELFRGSEEENSEKTMAQRLIEAKFNPEDERYDYNDFLHVWSKSVGSEDEEEQLLSKAFQFFDRDGNGVISSEEFKGVMCELGECLTEAECDQFFGIMDANNDGAIQYTEFIQALREARMTNLSRTGTQEVRRLGGRVTPEPVSGGASSSAVHSTEPATPNTVE